MAVDPNAKAYIVGSGIAGLATAVYLIRDGKFAGSSIQIFEETLRLGGSLDGGAESSSGFVTRGARMFTYEVYTCMLDLLVSIPSLTTPEISVAEEIYRFNRVNPFNPTCRLVSAAQRIDHTDLGLTHWDRMTLVGVMAIPEFALGVKRISDLFRSEFFRSNFWLRFCTSFAFQPWHSAVEFKRYLHRFIQEFPHTRTAVSIRRTPYNEYDSIVRPIVRWLETQGVRFLRGAKVGTMEVQSRGHLRSAARLEFYREGRREDITIRDKDFLFITNGSMTAASCRGSMHAPAQPDPIARAAAWSLWEALSARHHDFGRPEVFRKNPSQTMLVSFTVTLRDPAFFRLMEEFAGDAAGEGGVTTLKDSNWLLSILLPAQPHFLDQADGTFVFWGYGLNMERPGNVVHKAMPDCSGLEILTELLEHLPFGPKNAEIIASADCIPCLMPFITSQFMPRRKRDRPSVRPTGATNFAFIGQYCELASDVVFTMEYSVRSAQTAVYTLLGLRRRVSNLYKADRNPAVLLSALRTLLA